MELGLLSVYIEIGVRQKKVCFVIFVLGGWRRVRKRSRIKE